MYIRYILNLLIWICAELHFMCCKLCPQPLFILYFLFFIHLFFYLILLSNHFFAFFLTSNNTASTKRFFTTASTQLIRPKPFNFWYERYPHNWAFHIPISMKLALIAVRQITLQLENASYSFVFPHVSFGLTFLFVVYLYSQL